MVIERSAEPDTYDVADAVFVPLFGVDDVTVAICVIADPAVALLLTVTTKVNGPAVPIAIAVVSVQVRVASTQVHPEGPLSETVVVFVGRDSVNTGALAESGPEFVTVCV